MVDVKNQLMMRGTGGHKDYYVIAVKGKLGLGLKLLGMQPVSRTQVVYAIRLRSATLENEELETLYIDGTVPPSPEHEVAWPSLPWTTKGYERYSAVLQNKTAANFAVNERELVIPVEIKEKQFVNEWLDLIDKNVAGAKIILNREQLAEIFDEYEQALFPIIYKEIRAGQIQEEVVAEVEQSELQLSQKELGAKIKAKFVSEFPEDAEKDDPVETISEDLSEEEPEEGDDDDHPDDEDDEEEGHSTNGY